MAATIRNGYVSETVKDSSEIATADLAVYTESVSNSS